MPKKNVALQLDELVCPLSYHYDISDKSRYVVSQHAPLDYLEQTVQIDATLTVLETNLVTLLRGYAVKAAKKVGVA